MTRYLKNKDGRIFIATAALLKRNDMRECAGPDTVEKEVDDVEFVLKKATKQDILDRALSSFLVELDGNMGIGKLRKAFAAAEREACIKIIEQASERFSVDLDPGLSFDDLDEAYQEAEDEFHGGGE